MKADIISKVSELIRNRNEPKKNLELVKAESKSLSEDADSVEISKSAKDYQNLETQFEKEHFRKMENVKQRVQNNSYSIHPDVVDAIAEKIVALL